MPNFTAGTSFSDGVTNDVTAAKLNALVADAVPTSSLSLNSTTGTIGLFSSGTGTAATPAIQPAGDANTGIFFPAADTIAFSEGGAEAMRINSSGQVGIGSTAPNAKLFVSVGTSPNTAQLLVGYLDGSENYYDANTHYFRNGSAGEVMRINSGNVGIGITPSQKLDVNGASSIRGALFLGDGSSSVIRKLTSSTPLTFANNGGSAEMTIDSSGNVGIGTASPATKLTVSGSSGTGSELRVVSTGANTGGRVTLYENTSGCWEFATSGGANSALTVKDLFNNSERLRIDSSGNVGIGTASPSGPLHIRGATGRYAFPATSGSTQSNGLTLRLNDASDDNAILDIGGNSTSGYWLQATNNANLATNYPLLLNPNGGNVGIGTTSPSSYGLANTSKFVVTGSSRADTWVVGGTSTGAYTFFSNNAQTTPTNAFQIGQGYSSGSDNVGFLLVKAASPLIFGTSDTERLRIDSSGNLLVGTTSGAIHRIVKSSASDFAFQVSNTSSSTPYVQVLTFASAAPNDATSMFLRCDDTGQTGRIQLRSNGGLANYSANNVNLSDERLKQDIQASPSYLDKICSIPVVNFKYKDQTHSDYNLGVIAQRVEAVCPELVDVDGFGETPNDGIPLKSIYQTDLQYALMKCIQELKSENDSLKTRIEALEAA